MFQVIKSPATSPIKANKTVELVKAVKRPLNDTAVSPKDIKRIRPTLISSNTSKPKKNEYIDEDGFVDGQNNNAIKDDEQQLPSSSTNITENAITEPFAKLIDVCR